MLVAGTQTQPKLDQNITNTMPLLAPIPQALFQTRFWNESIGSNTSPNAVLFDFSQ